MAARTWSADDDAALTAAYARVPFEGTIVIAAAMDRSRRAVITRAAKLGLRCGMQGRPLSSMRISSDPIVAALMRRRCERGWARDTLAARLGYCVNSIADWEKGTTQPSLAALRAWCTALNVCLCLEPIDATSVLD